MEKYHNMIKTILNEWHGSHSPKKTNSDTKKDLPLNQKLLKLQTETL